MSAELEAKRARVTELRAAYERAKAEFRAAQDELFELQRQAGDPRMALVFAPSWQHALAWRQRENLRAAMWVSGPDIVRGLSPERYREVKIDEENWPVAVREAHELWKTRPGYRP